MQPMRPKAARSIAAAGAATDAYRSTQWLAWTVLLIAAALFVLLAILVPRGVGALLGGIQESRPTLAEVIEGTVLYRSPAAAAWQQLPNAVDLPEGTRLRTDDRSRVFLTLADGSTVLLYPNTELAVQRMAVGRFNPQSQETVLRLFVGRVNVAVARHPLLADRAIALLAADARLDLPEGSYQVEIERDGAIDVGVRMGAATLWRGDRALVVSSGLRGRLGTRVPIEGPLPAERPLLQAPIIGARADRSLWWGFAETEAGVTGSVAAHDHSVAFVRRTPDGATKNHGDVGLAQAIERDIRDYQRLHLIVDLRLIHQSLSGGGVAGTEYPLMVRVVYMDGAGREQIWTRGFYYQNQNNLNAKLGDQIPHDTWVTYDNPNLLQEMRPAPVALTRIEIMGSGWEFESGVRRVELTGA